MKKTETRLLLCGLAWCFAQVFLWGVLDGAALEMAGAVPLAGAGPAAGEAVRFDFPLLKSVWAFFAAL